MNTVLNPLAYKNMGPSLYYWFLLGTRNRMHYQTFLVEVQKAAIRKDPGEVSGKRNGRRNDPETVSFKTPQSGKFPGKETGREKPTIKKPAVREDPGRFREEKREEM